MNLGHDVTSCSVTTWYVFEYIDSIDLQIERNGEVAPFAFAEDMVFANKWKLQSKSVGKHVLSFPALIESFFDADALFQ